MRLHEYQARELLTQAGVPVPASDVVSSSDEAVAVYKRKPFMSFEERKAVVENIIGVDRVIEQTTLDYVPNLKKLKPEIVVHGDDWKTSSQSQVRQQVIDILKDWGGQLIEPEYTEGSSSTKPAVGLT